MPKEEAEAMIARFEEKEIALVPTQDRLIIFKDGYIGREGAERNLAALVSVVSQSPKKFFAAAAGNPTAGIPHGVPDIEEARAKLEEQEKWPPNLAMVGVWGPNPYGGGEAPYAFGADFYVRAHDLESFGFQPASSFATPMVSEIVNRLRMSGIAEPGEIKKSLREMSDADGIENPAYIINLDKVREWFNLSLQEHDH